MGKFETDDRLYFEHRARFAEKYRAADCWFIADNWPLFSGRANIARCLAVYELVKRVIDLPGHFCELGCWNGANLVYIAKIVSMLRPLGRTEVVGFDSFEGLTGSTPGKDARRGDAVGTYKGSAELLAVWIAECIWCVFPSRIRFRIAGVATMISTAGTRPRIDMTARERAEAPPSPVRAKMDRGRAAGSGGASTGFSRLSSSCWLRTASNTPGVTSRASVVTRAPPR